MNIGSIALPEYPIMLAPMEDITDPPFRSICKHFGADMMFTEFISADGLIRSGYKSEKKLDILPVERPIGIQIFGNSVDSVKQAAKMAEEADPDCIDLNFGCPVRKVVKKGGGAGLLKDIPLMIEIAREVVTHTNIPVTAKTRLGWDPQHIDIRNIALQLQDTGISALTIHGRTASQLYRGHADWNEIAVVKKDPKITIPVIGNGDIDSPEVALNAFKEYGVDGIMIGRAAIGNPWLFREIKYYFKTGQFLSPPTVEEKVRWVKYHLQQSIEWKGEYKGVVEMRTHFSNYFKGLPNIKPFRHQLVTEFDPEKIFYILDIIVDKYGTGVDT